MSQCSCSAIFTCVTAFEIEHLWQVATYEEARHDGPALCPLCQQKPLDSLK